jgi:hypothetical protein
LALPPSLSTASNVVYKGTLVTVSENPAGALPFHYQWQTDNGSGGVTFTDINGATNISVAVDTTSFTPGTPVEYRVAVTNNFGSSTSAAATITAITGAPVLLVDTLPASGSADVQGGLVTFIASFDGSRPIFYQWQVDTGGGPTPIAGATNMILTLSNLDFTATGSYSLVASNALGTNVSTASSFTVNALPAPDVNGVIAAPANQVGLGGNTEFTPTWVLATNSLINGAAPTLTAGNFQLEGSGGIGPMTDGRFGKLPPEGNASPDLSTCGTGGGSGSILAYTLPVSATGWDITNIVVYGGWSDSGRDSQRYQVYVSTTANPTNYNNLIADVNYDPTPGNSSSQQASRITLTSTNGALAKNIAGVEFFFNTLASSPENGYEGYAEFQVSGTPSAPAPVAVQPIEPGTGSDVIGSQLTITASFSSSTPMTLQWTKDGVNIPNATNSTLTIFNLQTTDSASSPGYVLHASNGSGSVASGACAFTVNSPQTDGIVNFSPANQTGNGATFNTTWTLAHGSLIAGQLPGSAANGGGSFGNEGAGGVATLTDGQFGSVGSAINTTLATCGSGAGGTLTYNLSGSEGGYDLTNIVVYGGWSDGGRDEQHYTIYYSTVQAPMNFIQMTAYAFEPTIPGAVPSATRMTYTSATTAPLATNVAAVKFDFTNPSGENGWSGYSEIQLFGSPSAAINNLEPVVTMDTIPAIGSDVVGGQVRFAASFGGTPPISYQWQKNGTNVPGASSSTLTLTSLQLSDSGSYNLVASNNFGVTSSSTNTFTVNPVPAPVNGIIIAPANQTSFGAGFTPTWSLAAGSLLAGQSPSSVGPGSFKNEGAGGLPVLTDGALGIVGAANATLATCGSGAGNSVVYSLPASSAGYSLSRIVTYGGWGDGGRDQQHYTVSYSTVANPTNFITLTSVSFDPTPPAPTTVPTADCVTIAPATAASLASGVAMLKFDFTTPSGENGWSGYSEIQVFGVPTPLQVTSTKVSGGKLILTGTGGTAGSGYTVLTATNLTSPLISWSTNTTGVFDGNGGFSNAIPINPSEPKRFFRFRTP